MRMKRGASFLLVVDVQEKLAPAVAGGETVIAHCATLIAAAKRLGVPALATEHYPRGIGRLVPALRDLLDPGAVLEKIHFSAADEPACRERLDALGRGQAVVCGTETHVCVQQTALALRETGREVFLVADASGSRHAIDRDTAIARMTAAGIRPVTTETVVFEWLARGDTPEFRDLLPLIKRTGTGG